MTKNELRSVEESCILAHFGVPGGKNPRVLTANRWNPKIFNHLVAQQGNRSTRIQKNPDGDLVLGA
jgi:hypothetical protein